jgi:hypothetical protein
MERNAKGQPYHRDWTGKFDDKNYALTGDPANDSVSGAKISSSPYDEQ